MRGLALVMVWLLGCADHRVVIQTGTVRSHLQELRTTDKTTVYVFDQHDDHSRKVRETIHADDRVTVDGTPRTFRSLASGCDPARAVVDQPGCLLADLDNTAMLELRTYRRPRFGPIITGAILASFTAAATCHFACAERSDARRVADIDLIGTSAVAGAGILYVIVACLTGSCRD
jgi:hypothetical protein